MEYPLLDVVVHYASLPRYLSCVPRATVGPRGANEAGLLCASIANAHKAPGWWIDNMRRVPATTMHLPS